MNPPLQQLCFEIGHFIDKYTVVHCTFCVNGKEAMQWEELRVVILFGVRWTRMTFSAWPVCSFYTFCLLCCSIQFLWRMFLCPVRCADGFWWCKTLPTPCSPHLFYLEVSRRFIGDDPQNILYSVQRCTVQGQSHAPSSHSQEPPGISSFAS